MTAFSGDLDAVILAGGRARRLGGAAKPLLEVGGMTLLDRAIAAAARAGSARIVAVGPTAATALPVTWCREDPPFGGPVAALVAALPLVTAEWMLLLAADVPRAAAAVAVLVAGSRHEDGATLVDPGGRRQWLLGLYHSTSLRERVAGTPESGRDQPLRTLLEGLSLAAVPDDGGLSADVDTWQDLEDARRPAGAGEDPR